jgi:hypothetical protein
MKDWIKLNHHAWKLPPFHINLNQVMRISPGRTLAGQMWNSVQVSFEENDSDLLLCNLNGQSQLRYPCNLGTFKRLRYSIFVLGVDVSLA